MFRALLEGPFLLFLGVHFVLGALMGCGGNGTGPSDDPGESPVPCLSPTATCREYVPIGSGLHLPVYRSHPVAAGDSSVLRAVIVVHGMNRNADDYFETMVSVVNLEGTTTTTLVMAPHFQTADDNPGPSEPCWTSAGWKRGHNSIPSAGDGTRISSYEALDEVLAYLLNRSLFPKLQSVVVTGHSAGGQYAHRFAATSPTEGAPPGLPFRYVVANPSTYLYPGPERKQEDGGFALPDRDACPDYNEWHYGLEERNSYASRLPEAEIVQRLLGRDVVYLVGSADTDTHLLDMTCGAMLQGSNRYERGLTILEFLDTLFPSHLGRLDVVPNVGHSNTDMYRSAEGRRALFRW